MKSEVRQACVVMISAPNQDEAQRLARMLIEKRLAACVQILPNMQSLYVWQGSVEHADENLLLVKTTLDLFAQLEAAVRAEHSYETPEIIAVPAVASSRPYLSWMMEHVSSVDEIIEEQN